MEKTRKFRVFLLISLFFTAFNNKIFAAPDEKEKKVSPAYKAIGTVVGTAIGTAAVYGAYKLWGWARQAEASQAEALIEYQETESDGFTQVIITDGGTTTVTSEDEFIITDTTLWVGSVQDDSSAGSSSQAQENVFQESASGESDSFKITVIEKLNEFKMFVDEIIETRRLIIENYPESKGKARARAEAWQPLSDIVESIFHEYDGIGRFGADLRPLEAYVEGQDVISEIKKKVYGLLGSAIDKNIPCDEMRVQFISLKDLIISSYNFMIKSIALKAHSRGFIVSTCGPGQGAFKWKIMMLKTSIENSVNASNNVLLINQDAKNIMSRYLIDILVYPLEKVLMFAKTSEDFNKILKDQLRTINNGVNVFLDNDKVISDVLVQPADYARY